MVQNVHGPSDVSNGFRHLLDRFHGRLMPYISFFQDVTDVTSPAFPPILNFGGKEMSRFS